MQLQERVFISTQLKWLDYIQHAYKRLSCSQKNDSDNIIKAPIPKTPLAYSLDSASIIAHTIYQKFNLQVPNYRQEEDWAKINFPMKNAMGRLHIIYTFAPVLAFWERLIP